MMKMEARIDMNLTEKQLKAIEQIIFHANDLKVGLELGQFAEEDIEAIRKACDIVVSPWISVEDELPEDYEDVQFTAYDYVYEGYHVKSVPEWVSSGGLYIHGNRYADVTHWMPLPALPEESDEA